MQKGIRERLLCSICEGKISRYETYAARILKNSDCEASNEQGYVVIRHVDLTMFRLFDLSLIWRLHVARSYMFGTVDLGSHAEKVRARLVAENPGEYFEYGFAIARIEGLGTHGSMLVAPTKRRYRERWVYHFTARGYEWAFLAGVGSPHFATHFPFVGATNELIIPVAHHDQHNFFSHIRRSFPPGFKNPLRRN